MKHGGIALEGILKRPTSKLTSENGGYDAIAGLCCLAQCLGRRGEEGKVVQSIDGQKVAADPSDLRGAIGSKGLRLSAIA